MTIKPKLTAAAACRVARIDRDRLNEHIAAGRFRCAPDTIPGRARLFDPDDMIALWLFRELMDDGFDAARAGVIACDVARVARDYPESQAICYAQTFSFPTDGFAIREEDVSAEKDWRLKGLGGTYIRKLTTFNIVILRQIIARETAEENSVIGERD